MKKLFCLILAGALCACALTGCRKAAAPGTDAPETTPVPEATPAPETEAPVTEALLSALSGEVGARESAV